MCTLIRNIACACTLSGEEALKQRIHHARMHGLSHDLNLACAQSSGSSASHARMHGCLIRALAVGLGPPGTPYCMLQLSPRGVVVAYGTLKPGLHPGRCIAPGVGNIFPFWHFEVKYPCVACITCPATTLVGSQPTWSEKGESFEMLGTPVLRRSVVVR